MGENTGDSPGRTHRSTPGGGPVSMERSKITIQEVAQDAGVSLATVSRVINGTGPVKQDTRQRVMDSMEKLGYRGSEATRGAQMDSRVLLFNLPIISNPFYTEIIRGAKLSAAQHGFHVLFHEGHVTTTDLPELLSVIKKVKVAGLIIANQTPTQLLRELATTVPVVQCCEYNDEVNLPFVSVDDVQASIRAVNHLGSLGKRRIAILNGPERYKYARHRLQGYQLGLRRLGLDYDPALVVNLPDINYSLAVSATMQLIGSPNPPDAFFTCSDVFAAAAIRAVKLCGYRVPEDFPIVGFDNTDITSITVPSITTVNQPRLQMGFSACEMLIERLQNPNAPIRQIFMETELIVRESTGYSLPMQ